MTSKPWPVLLTIAAIVIVLGILATEWALRFAFGKSLWVASACQVLPQSFRTCLIWMIGCFITMRHGSTTMATRIVPIGVFVLLVASHAIARWLVPGDSDWEWIAVIALGELTTLVLASVCVLFFSKLLNISLRRVSCTEEIAPLRIRVQTMLVATTCIAIFLGIQNGTSGKYSIVAGSADEVKAIYFLIYILNFICNGFVFFGLIWLVASNKRRWLGIVGFLVWPAAPIAQICLLLSPSIQKELPFGVVSTFVAVVSGIYVTVLLGIWLTVPIFRLFGYQFRIGNQQEPVPTALNIFSKG